MEKPNVDSVIEAELAGEPEKGLVDVGQPIAIPTSTMFWVSWTVNWSGSDRSRPVSGR